MRFVMCFSAVQRPVRVHSPIGATSCGGRISQLSYKPRVILPELPYHQPSSFLVSCKCLLCANHHIELLMPSSLHTGKHISFDGRLLHGAPAGADLWNIGRNHTEASTGSRVTFLVNIWLNYVPLSTERLGKCSSFEIYSPKSLVTSLCRDQCQICFLMDHQSPLIVCASSHNFDEMLP